jgi:hypothetical protein
MKTGPSRWRPEPGMLPGLRYCLVCDVSEVDEGWLEVDEDDWFVEPELADWLPEPELADWFAEPLLAEFDAPEPIEPELADWFAEAELGDWLPEPKLADWLPDDAALSRPAICAPAALAWSIAACVRGPLMPSIGPGSKPLSFSACWSWRTDSSPWAWLPEALAEPEVLAFDAEALLAPFEPLFEPEAIEDEEGWLAEAEDADGFDDADWLDDADWFVDADGLDVADWFAEVEADGWLVEADEALLSAAITEPAAIKAAARASFLNFMDCVLSYGQLTAVRFGPCRAGKLHRVAAPSDARRLTAIHGGPAT